MTMGIVCWSPAWLCGLPSNLIRPVHLPSVARVQPRGFGYDPHFLPDSETQSRCPFPPHSQAHSDPDGTDPCDPTQLEERKNLELLLEGLSSAAAPQRDGLKRELKRSPKR